MAAQGMLLDRRGKKPLLTEEKFHLCVPDWDTRKRERPDLENSLLVLGRYTTIYHLETETGRNIGVHPCFASQWGLARVSDPNRLDSFAMGTYNQMIFPSDGARSKQSLQAVAVYRAPDARKNHLALPRWLCAPEFSPPGGDVRCVIPLRGAREAEDLFMTLSFQGASLPLWSTKLVPPPNVPPGGKTRGRHANLKLWPTGKAALELQPEAPEAGSQGKERFVPYSAAVEVKRLGGSWGAVNGAGGIHEGLMCLVLANGSDIRAVDARRMFEGIGGEKMDSCQLWKGSHGEHAHFIDTSGRFEGVLDTYGAGSHLTNVACSSGGERGKFWDIKTGQCVGRISLKDRAFVNRFVPARQLWFFAHKKGIDAVDIRKLSVVAATVRDIHGNRPPDIVRDVEDVGSDGRTFVSASQNNAVSLWTLDEALKVKLHWTRMMPASTWAAKSVNKGRDGLLLAARPTDPEEFERVLFGLQLSEDVPGAILRLRFSSMMPLKIIRSPRCFM